MQAMNAKPRSLLGIVPIALLLGPTSLMLWLGRWRTALLYVLAILVAVGLLFALPVISPFRPVTVLGLSDACSIIGLAISVIGLVHAIRIRNSALRRPWYSRWFVALPLPLVTVLALALGVRTFFYQPFNIPSAAMYPTLKVGDYIFVSKLHYGYGKYSFNFSVGARGYQIVKCCPFDFSGRVFFPDTPERGDVAVFKLPTNTEVDYIKRVIGLPGDRIQMREGVLHINGTAVKKERIADFVDPNGEGGGSPVPQYIETLPNGVQYRVLDAEFNGEGDNTMEYAVPPGHYFMLGDNRDNSQDSRYLNEVGYVPEENFVGPVVLRYWSSKGFSLSGLPENASPTK